MNLKRRDFIKKLSCACCAPLFLPSCTEVAITNRKQLSIISDESINKQALQAYEQVKKQENLIESGQNFSALREVGFRVTESVDCLLYTSPSPRDRQKSRMPSSA